MDKDLMFLADFLEQYYILPYTHEELLDILSRMKNGYFLSESEYEAFKNIILGDEDIEGDVLFSGNYQDLINKPYIPKKLSDLQDYNTFISVINDTWAKLKQEDVNLGERISDNARFVSALEVVLTEDIKRLEKMISACQLFEGDSLADVINNIKTELGWLDIIKQDIEKGKVLSEKDFTAVYEEILKSINETTNGLTGYIKKVIAESIVEPGEPNSGGATRLDSIGEALFMKVDKVYGYGLSKNDFSDKYKEILDCILEHDGNGTGTLEEYIIDVVDRYEEEFNAMINRLGKNMVEYTENQIQDMKKHLSDKMKDVDQQLQETKEQTLYGITFKPGDGPSSITIGGLEKGSILEERTIREVLLEMLCPFVMPSVVATIQFGEHGDFLNEIGTIVEVAGIVANIERGSYPISKILFKKKVGNTYEILQIGDGSDTEHWNPDLYEITQSVPSDYFIVEVEDTAGNIATCNTQAIDIIYPIYYGTIAADKEPDGTINKLHKTLKAPGTSCRFFFSTKNERMVFAVPQGYGVVSEIVDQNGYNITNSFNTKTITLKFKVKESVNDTVVYNEYSQNYFVYYNNPSTVTRFEVVFNF